MMQTSYTVIRIGSRAREEGQIMLVLMLLLSTLSEGEAPYVLVLKQGQRLEIQGVPTYDGKFAYFTTLDGEKSMLPLHVVDREGTKTYNDELAAKREADMVAESQLAEDETQDEEEPKDIRILRRSQIPAYDRESNVTVATGVAGNEQGDLGEDVIGSPKVTQWQSQDAFFISKETVIRKSNGWEIRCEISSNHPTGVSNLTVSMVAHFEGGEQFNLSESPEPNQIEFGETGEVVFDLDSTAEILRTDYTLTADLGIAQLNAP